MNKLIIKTCLLISITCWTLFLIISVKDIINWNLDSKKIKTEIRDIYKNIKINETTDKNYINSQLNSHIHKVCKKLRTEKLLTSCVGVMLRTKDFQIFNNKINLTNSTNTEFELTNVAKKMLDEMFIQGVIYRSVGFFATKLTPQNSQQISLFDGAETIKKQELSKSWDKLEEKFGKGVIKLGNKKATT